MKKIIIALFLIGGINNVFAQIETKTYEKEKAFEKHPMFETTKQNSPEKKMPLFDVSVLLAEDEAIRNLDLPFRFGKSFDVNLSLQDGQWQKNDSSEVWSLKISSDNAYSLNFIFSELYLPEEGKLHIFNEGGTMVYGPVTKEQNEHGNTFLTDIISGNSVTIQITVPLGEKKNTKLTVQNVIHGYKNIFNPVDDPGYGQSQDCTDDVACWQQRNDEADGVVQILLSTGDELCSGALLNNTAEDFKPYVLTAFHCIDIGDPAIPHYPPLYNDPDEGNGSLEQYEIDEAEEWLVRFGFKHTECDGNTIGSVYTFDDTHYRAGWDSTDFALVEMVDNIISDQPSVGEKVWLGWDRSGNTPTSGFGIHHPSGDIMKHSVEINQFSTSTFIDNYYQRVYLTNGHWLVNFDDGVVEKGSSGSPIFDQNERVVGQLTGNQNYDSNQSYCSQPRAEYGKFHLSWDGGGTATTRLSDWLDPLNTGVTTLNSVRPNPEYSGIPEQLCSTTTISVTNLPPGYTFQQWNGSNVTFSSSTSNPVQVTPVSNGEGWVEAVVHTGWGTATMPRMHFWTGAPDPNDFEVYVEELYGNPVPGSPDGPFEVCQGERYWISLYPFFLFDKYGITDVEFDFNFDYSVLGEGDDYIEIEINSNPDYEEGEVYVTTTCGYYTLKFMEFVEGNCGYYLMFSPNPTTGETTLSIEKGQQEETVLKSASAGESFDMNAEWDMEIYSPMQVLKTKKTKLKGKSTTIQTAGWTEGIYTVRVNYKGDIITGKLIVKK